MSGHVDSTAGRVPPHDLAAEAAVLSAILLESNSLTRVRPLLKPARFYSDANRRVYEAACEVQDSGNPVDIVSVASWLRDRDLLQQVGGASYLAQLSDATPAVAHVASHAQLVVEKHRLREFIASCQRAAAEGYGDIGGTVDEFVGQHQQTILQILRSVPGRNEPKRVQDILKDTIDNVDEEHQRRLSGKPSRRIVSSGYPHVNAYLSGGGLMRGRLHIIAARPGMGKTAFATNLTCNVCEQPSDEDDPGFEHVEHAAFFWSGEMPREELVLRMLCSEAKLDFGAVASGNLSSEDWTELMNAAGWLGSLPLWIDDTPGITLAELQAKVRDVQATWERPANAAKKERERRLSLVVVDYLTLMRGSGREHSRQEEVAAISMGLKELAKRLLVPVIALAQLNRSNETRGAKDRRPALADLRESGQIEQDGDFIGFLHRPHYYEPTRGELDGIAELIIRKQRSGRTGYVFLYFDGPRMRFQTMTPSQVEHTREVYKDGFP